jgi:hypothetical protein
MLTKMKSLKDKLFTVVKEKKTTEEPKKVKKSKKSKK